MSRVPKHSRHRPGLGLVLLFGATSLLLGVGLDFVTASDARFWIDERPGALALFGAGVAIGAVGLAQMARLALRRRGRRDGERGGRHADA